MHFWGNIFDYFKDRRFATVFFGTLLVLVLVSVAGSALYGILGPDKFCAALLYSLPVPGLIVMIQFWRWLRDERKRRRDRYKISPLSRDEIHKARSKLTRAK